MFPGIVYCCSRSQLKFVSDPLDTRWALRIAYQMTYEVFLICKCTRRFGRTNARGLVSRTVIYNLSASISEAVAQFEGLQIFEKAVE